MFFSVYSGVLGFFASLFSSPAFCSMNIVLFSLDWLVSYELYFHLFSSYISFTHSNNLLTKILRCLLS